ncbi:hypothetical protein LTR16_002536 [Cryomyces antarcticus]|uniref:Mid2 domain-containing protein n=1 Tax=Cryomyces antarcticus TaxID=329879 RepID=A0ABR0LPH2_9PEZI|nr:hypothetical protein LTR16_002536 [Cryomyces antarcticus]
MNSSWNCTHKPPFDLGAPLAVNNTRNMFGLTNATGLALLYLIGCAASQRSDGSNIFTTPTPSLGSTQTTPTPSSSSSHSKDRIESLIAIGESLISSYYPSTTITDIATLTLPSTVVIGSSTFIVHTTSNSTPTPTSTSTSTSTSPNSSSSPSSSPTSSSSAGPLPTAAANASSSSTNPSSTNPSRRNVLPIVLGVVFGFLGALIIAALAWFLYRRRSKQGFVGRQATPLNDSEIDTWRGTDNQRQWPEKYGAVPALPPQGDRTPIFTVRNPDEVIAPENPFFTAAERRDAAMPSNTQLPGRSPILSYPDMTVMGDDAPPLPNHRANSLAYYVEDPHQYYGGAPYAYRGTDAYYHGNDSFVNSYPYRGEESHLNPAQDQDVTNARYSQEANPFYGEEAHLNPAQDVADMHHAQEANPFYVEDDNQLLPWIPPKSANRRSSPHVHYPSRTETAKFDFGLDGMPQRPMEEESFSQSSAALMQPEERADRQGRF